MSTSTTATARSYDAVSLLGFGPVVADVLLPGNPGETVLRHGGWSLQELRDKRGDLMHPQDWYDQYPWASERLPSGIYVLRLPIPGSNRKTFDEQNSLLSPGEEPAPIVLAVSALLSICLSGVDDPLKRDWTRTGQQTGGGSHAVLHWYEGRLNVYNVWHDSRYDGVWLAAARWTS